MSNAWDRVGTPAGRRTASRVLVVVGGVLLVLATLAVVLYRTFLDTASFAAGVDEIRQTPVVSEALGVELADQIVQADPDLQAVRPLIEQVAGFVAGSEALSPLVVRAAAEAQEAATSADGSAVLRLADAGVVAASALESFAPDLAARIPADLSVTLASIGSQDVFATSLLFSRFLSVAAWALPVLGLGCLAMAVWVAPNQRRALVRAGLATLVAGAVVGVLTLAAGIAVATLDGSTLPGALADGAWQVWSRGFWLASGVLVVVGALIASAASALLPDIEVDRVLAEARRRVTARPSTTEGVALRGLLIAALGVGLVVAPLRLLSWGAVLVGLAVLAYGVSEITAAAVSARHGEPVAPPPEADQDVEGVGVGWRLGAVAVGAVAVLGIGALLLVRDVQTEPAAAIGAGTVGTGTVCNGHAELCSRRYPEVAYLTSHNAMSAADQPGWFLAEQPHGVVDQLNGGVRGLMLDVWRARPAGEYVSSLAVNLDEGRAQLEESFGPEAVASAERLVQSVVGEPTGPPALYLCHGLCEIGATPLSPTLDALRAWLDANPDEVVTVIVENHVPATEIAAAFVEADLEPYLHTPDAQRWPTLGEMTTSGRRLVVMTEEGDGGSSYPWLANAFALTQDTPYTFPSPTDFSCEPNRGATDAPLFLVNHWLSGFTAIVSAAEQVNTTEVLGERLQQCAQQRDLFPTFVGVNYYDLGDVADVVDELNGVAE